MTKGDKWTKRLPTKRNYEISILWHTVVCQRPRKQKKTCSTQVCYLLVLWSYQIQPSISPKLLSQFLPKFIYFLSYIYITSHIKIDGNHFSSSRDICSWKLPNFLYILLHTKLQIYLSHVKITFSCCNFFQIWNTNNAHLDLHFPKILRNFPRKIEGAMYYNITIFSQFVVAFTGCIISAMDLKFFPTL